MEYSSEVLDHVRKYTVRYTLLKLISLCQDEYFRSNFEYFPYKIKKEIQLIFTEFHQKEDVDKVKIQLRGINLNEIVNNDQNLKFKRKIKLNILKIITV